MLREDISIMEDCREEVSSYDELLAYVFKFWLRVRSLIEIKERPEDELHRIWFDNLPDYVDSDSEEFHKLYDFAGKPYYEDDVDEEVDFGSYAECGFEGFPFLVPGVVRVCGLFSSVPRTRLG